MHFILYFSVIVKRSVTRILSRNSITVYNLFDSPDVISILAHMITCFFRMCKLKCTLISKLYYLIIYLFSLIVFASSSSPF